MKKLLLILLLTISSLSVFAHSEMHVDTRPEFKVGKMENGAFFMELTPFNQMYTFNKRFRTNFKMGVGFTAPRENKRAMNHYVNTILVRNELVLNHVILFAEFNWGNYIEGWLDPSSYFSGTYQAIGFNLEF